MDRSTHLPKGWKDQSQRTSKSVLTSSIIVGEKRQRGENGPNFSFCNRIDLFFEVENAMIMSP